MVKPSMSSVLLFSKTWGIRPRHHHPPSVLQGENNLERAEALLTVKIAQIVT
jgi:hypothetical protein